MGPGVTTAEFGGLIIQNVTPGNRVIRVVREGFNPQQETLTIRAGEVYSHRVSPFIPAIRITERGSEGEQSIDLDIPDHTDPPPSGMEQAVSRLSFRRILTPLIENVVT